MSQILLPDPRLFESVLGCDTFGPDEMSFKRAIACLLTLVWFLEKFPLIAARCTNVAQVLSFK
jgi:hypothetical protein